MSGLAEQTAARAEWKHAHGYRPVERRSYCEHVLRKVPCPSTTRYRACQERIYAIHDHGFIWQRRDGSRFLLAHVYTDPAKSLREAQEWAAARGLVVTSDPADGWYGFDTTPLRYDLA